MDGSRTGRSAARSVLLYCHDSYGLGHLRRTLALAHELRAAWPDVRQLVVTGSPLAHCFALPEGADYVKLPAAVKTGAGTYESRDLPLAFGELRAFRAELVEACARRLRPELVIVDNVPAGLEGELLPALRHLRSRSPRTKLVLGLRDIVDEPSVVRRAWTRERLYELLDEVYDRILVYGDRGVYDTVERYGLPAAKSRYVGYLRRGTTRRAAFGERRRPLVLATAGGGGDGAALLRAAVAAQRFGGRERDCILVTGPLSTRREQRELQQLANDVPRTRVLEFVEDLPAYMAAADVVVSMGGYNSVCELLTLGTPGVLVPRVEPRREQLIRARALARRGLVRLVDPGELSPRRLAHEIERALASPPAGAPVSLDGLANATVELDRLLQTGSRELAVVS